MVTNDERPVRLAEAIEHVRAELEEAIRLGRGSPVLFQAGPVELEFAVEFEKSREAKGGLRVWVVTLGGRRASSSTATHKLKFVMTPRTQSGGDQLIDDVD